MCMCVCPHVRSDVSEKKKNIKIPESGVAGSCESPKMNGRSQTLILCMSSKSFQVQDHLSNPEWQRFDRMQEWQGNTEKGIWFDQSQKLEGQRLVENTFTLFWAQGRWQSSNPASLRTSFLRHCQSAISPPQPFPWTQPLPESLPWTLTDIMLNPGGSYPRAKQLHY